MEANVIATTVMQLVLTFIIAVIIKTMVNKGLFTLVHTLEVISAFLSILYFKQQINDWFVSLTVMTLFWRHMFRLWSDCINTVKEYTKKA